MRVHVALSDYKQIVLPLNFTREDSLVPCWYARIRSCPRAPPRAHS